MIIDTNLFKVMSLDKTDFEIYASYMNRAKFRTLRMAWIQINKNPIHKKNINESET